MHFELEHQDVPSRTTARVKESLARGSGCVVVGRPGTGKSHAVKQAVNGSIWLDLREGEHQFDFFFAQLAAQVHDGQPIIDALAARDTGAVFAAADVALGADPLVIDRGERLRFHETWGWDDPVEALWRPNQARLARWIDERMGTQPLVVIARGRRNFLARHTRIQHVSSGTLPLELTRSERGFRDWPTLGKALAGSPAGLWVGALLLELMTAQEWNDLVSTLPVSSPEEGDQSVDALADLLGALKDRMPDDWRRVLSTVHELEGAPAEIIQRIVDAEGNAATLAYLEDLGAIARRDDRLFVLPALQIEGPIAALHPAERGAILTNAAAAMLERVSDLDRPDARSAESIVFAHSLYVEAGDFEAARRTARFHLGGLVRLARQTSLRGEYGEARRLYGIIEPLAASEPRAESYVVHYQHMNGHWSRELPPAMVLSGLTRAREMWPENALWWQRETELLLDLGRVNDALDTIARAYGAVAEHPRRDFFLRIRPALHAVRVPGAGAGALRLIEPLMSGDHGGDPEARAGIADILRRWEHGMEVMQLGRASPGLLLFHAPVTVTLERLDAEDYRAECRAMERAARATTPLRALDDLASKVAGELRRLIETPSTRLTPEDVRRKGTLIGLVDVLNSDIGLAHASERWILGRFEDRSFVPVLAALPPMYIDPAIEIPRAGEHTLYLGKFPVHRDGRPAGAPTAWELAGSGRSAADLWRRLQEIGGAGDG